MGATEANLTAFKGYLDAMTIGPDKVNQLRHVRFLKDMDGVAAHMDAHREILAPKFACVEQHLSDGLQGLGKWTQPSGGYFVWVRSTGGKTTGRSGAGMSLAPDDAYADYMRLGFAWLTDEQIVEGVRYLSSP